MLCDVRIRELFRVFQTSADKSASVSAKVEDRDASLTIIHNGLSNPVILNISVSEEKPELLIASAWHPADPNSQTVPEVTSVFADITGATEILSELISIPDCESLDTSGLHSPAPLSKKITHKKSTGAIATLTKAFRLFRSHNSSTDLAH